MRITPELIEGCYQYTNKATEDRELRMRSLQIAAIENLGATLNQFDCFDLSHNKIKKLENLPLLPRLKCILLSNNNIYRISANLEQSVPNLERLILTSNYIQELSDIDPLTTLKNLRILSLLNNPITSKPNYRYYVIHKLPSLKLLDFSKVNFIDFGLLCKRFFVATMDRFADNIVVKIINYTIETEFWDHGNNTGNYRILWNLMNVCKRWRNLIAKDSTLRAIIDVNVENGFPEAKNIVEFISDELRFQLIGGLYLRGWSYCRLEDEVFTADECHKIVEAPNLRALQIECWPRSGVDQVVYHFMTQNHSAKLEVLVLTGFPCSLNGSFWGGSPRLFRDLLNRFKATLRKLWISNECHDEGGLHVEAISFPNLEEVIIESEYRLFVDVMVNNMPHIRILNLNCVTLFSKGQSSGGLSYLEELIIENSLLIKPELTFYKLTSGSKMLKVLKIVNCIIPFEVIVRVPSNRVRILVLDRGENVAWESKMYEVPPDKNYHVLLKKWRCSLEQITLRGWSQGTIDECVEIMSSQPFKHLSRLSFATNEMSYEKLKATLNMNKMLTSIEALDFSGAPESCRKKLIWRSLSRTHICWRLFERESFEDDPLFQGGGKDIKE